MTLSSTGSCRGGSRGGFSVMPSNASLTGSTGHRHRAGGFWWRMRQAGKEHHRSWCHRVGDSRTPARRAHRPHRRGLHLLEHRSGQTESTPTQRDRRPARRITSRLTLLALESRRLSVESHGPGKKKVNLVSFTPGTSFEMGWQTGSQEERQLLHIILNGMGATGDPPEHEQASALFFQGYVRKLSTFEAGITRMRTILDQGPPDEVIVRAFRDAIDTKGLTARFEEVRDQLRGGRDTVPDELKGEVKGITAEMRHALAAASVESLEPDLVILDEFQRFRHLIDPHSGSDASELAHHLFNYPDAKVLLLSATPYKPYTTVEGDSDDDHYRDFMTTLEFLADRDDAALSRIRTGFQRYREAVVSGSHGQDEASDLRDALVPYMTRSERPRLQEGRDLAVRHIISDVPAPEDLRSYAALQAFARLIEAPVSLDYWKSIPYFASFMEGYRPPGEKARAEVEKATATVELQRAIRKLRSLDPPDLLRTYGVIDFANARLRAFAANTLDAAGGDCCGSHRRWPTSPPRVVFMPGIRTVR